MADEKKVKESVLRLAMTDITNLEIDSFVYYAQHDLALGSGFGTAISVRGGPSVQKELNEMGPLKTTEVIVSGAGELKAKHIIHAVGPRFQEEDLEAKLKTTVENCLKAADAQDIKQIAFPPMGAGFYGVPLDVSARITLGTIENYLAGDTGIREVTICLYGNREYQPYQKQLASLG
jgi:O-acetyl-ADP-ribose deacetylase (regulator of RNase III)